MGGQEDWCSFSPISSWVGTSECLLVAHSVQLRVALLDCCENSDLGEGAQTSTPWPLVSSTHRIWLNRTSRFSLLCQWGSLVSFVAATSSAQSVLLLPLSTVLATQRRSPLGADFSNNPFFDDIDLRTWRLLLELSNSESILFHKSEGPLAIQSHLKILQTFILFSLTKHHGLVTKIIDLTESLSLEGDGIWLGNFGFSATNSPPPTFGAGLSSGSLPWAGKTSALSWRGTVYLLLRRRGPDRVGMVQWCHHSRSPAEGITRCLGGSWGGSASHGSSFMYSEVPCFTCTNFCLGQIVWLSHICKSSGHQTLSCWKPQTKSFSQQSCVFTGLCFQQISNSPNLSLFCKTLWKAKIKNC